MSNITISSATLKLSQSYARESRRLWNALADYIGHESVNTDNKRDVANKAAATVGARILRDKLPREAGPLRVEVESMLQKSKALLAQCDGKGLSFINHCERKSIVLECAKAVRYCETFIAAYVEAKAATNVAKAA